MQSWLPDIAAGSGPIYLAIANALSRDIEGGILRPGDRLPPQRALAEALAIDLTTVTKAYNEVRRLGLIEGGGRRGSFVRTLGRSNVASDPAIDSGMNLPPEPAFCSLAARFSKGMAELTSGPAALSRFQYQPQGGAQGDRLAGARLLEDRGIATTEDHVLITAGGQNALYAIVSSELFLGDNVAIAAHAYPGFLAIARRKGLNLIPVACDAGGIDPDALKSLCRTRTIKALYTVPTNDNPTTATLSIERRKMIARLADAYGFIVIEDDAYGLLPETPLPPIASFAPERCWHIASLSKILSPALRVAWVAAPSVPQAWKLASDAHETTVMAPPLNAALATLWLEDGSFDMLIAEMRNEARARQEIARDMLGKRPYAAHPEGYHLWLPLEAVNLNELVSALRPLGLSAVSSNAFAIGKDDGTSALRISMGGGLTRERLSRALRVLDALIDQGAPPRSMLI